MIFHRACTPPIERMLARKIVDADGCWVWPGAVNGPTRGGGGYGQVRDTVERKTLMVHLVSYRHFVGEIPDGFVIDHRCHNEDASCPGNGCKHRRCWNPDHLVARPFTDNCADGRAPGETAVRVGWCQKGLHERTPQNLIVNIRKSGTVHTQCRPCFNASQNARRALRRAG